MPFDAKLIDNVFLLRWKETARVEDVKQLPELIDRARAAVGSRLVYIAVIPVDCAPPEADARVKINEGVQDAAQFCSSIHTVIEGTGLRRALFRSVVAGILLASSRRGQSFHIHENVRDALTKAREKMDVDVERVLTAARNDGLLSAGN
jgi:hypothetical protein